MPAPPPADRARAAEGILAARPHATRATIAPGLHPLGITRGREALLYVPKRANDTTPAPLAVMLHGAGADADDAMSIFQGLADRFGLVILAPGAQASTWDMLVSRFGPDVAFIDAALATTFERCAIDRESVAIGGFSDGASYALSLGLTNGDLFTHVIALSPGFMAPGRQEGAPRIFISHGTRDTVLPIERCSRRLVPVLEHAGYEVQYREFTGPHTVPRTIAREALEWFTGDVTPSRQV